MNSIHIRRLISFLIKNHYLTLTIVIGLQYLSGKTMAGDFPSLLKVVPYQTVSTIHQFLGFLLLAATILLFLSKMYLLILQKRAKLQAATPV